MPKTTTPTAEQIELALGVMCPRCGALPGVRCRTQMYQKAIKSPHNDRLLLGMPRLMDGGDGV